MDIVPQASLFIGIIPALIILYVSIKGYEKHYKDRNIFLSFVTGIIIGFISALVRLVVGAPVFLIVFAVIYALFDQLFKTIVLNIGRLHEKSETVIYGLTLGLGFGAVFTPFLIIAASNNGVSSIISIILVAIGSFGIILFHAGTGTLIGYGIFSGGIIKYLIPAILLQIPFNLLIDAASLYSDEYFVFLQIGSVIFGGIIFGFVATKIMPRILNGNKRRMRTKK